ncbi:MAG: hypothetical protein WBG90_00145 [Saonia sp.]
MKSVAGEYFRLDDGQMDATIEEVIGPVRQWKKTANEIGIFSGERELMVTAFILDVNNAGNTIKK